MSGLFEPLQLSKQTSTIMSDKGIDNFSCAMVNFVDDVPGFVAT